MQVAKAGHRGNMHGVPIRGEIIGRRICACDNIPRHRHEHGYLTLVLRGGFVEAGDTGRYRAEVGSVLIHRPYHAHLNSFDFRAADFLNLPLTREPPRTGAIRIANPDEVVRTAEKDVLAAAELIWSSGHAVEAEQDWPDLLAERLRRMESISIEEWAREHGLHPSTVSRGFCQVFGTTPLRYRAEARTRRAVRAISAQTALADLAFLLGFADQAHMTRSVVGMTGLTPGRLRTQVK